MLVLSPALATTETHVVLEQCTPRSLARLVQGWRVCAPMAISEMNRQFVVRRRPPHNACGGRLCCVRVASCYGIIMWVPAWLATGGPACRRRLFPQVRL